VPFVARAEISSLYAEHDNFVLPSLMEGMPLVLLEAMGLRDAGGDHGIDGMTDLVEDSHDGAFCDSRRRGIAFDGYCQALPRFRAAAASGRCRSGKDEALYWNQAARRTEMVFYRALG